MPAEKRRKAEKLYIQFACIQRIIVKTYSWELKDELFQKEIENLCDECGVCEK